MVTAAAWAWTLAIFVLLWMPPPPPPEIVWPWWDSLVHTGLLLAFGALWTLHGLASGRVLVLGAVVGAATEIGQALLPWERHASWDDLAFDLLGVTLGWLAARGPWRRRGVEPRAYVLAGDARGSAHVLDSRRDLHTRGCEPAAGSNRPLE